MASASLPTIAFGAAGNVLAELGRASALADIDFSQLRFSAPKDAEDNGDSKVCIAKAFLLPGKGSLKVRLTAPVVKVTHSRRDAHTIAVSTSASGLQAFLLALDARVLEVAQVSTDAWFMSKMNADLIEEYYRGCTAVQHGHGTVGRFVVDGAPELPAAIEAGASVDVVFQLVGLQFRPQYFTCVWKVVKASSADLPPAALQSLPPAPEEVVVPKKKQQQKQQQPVFVPPTTDDDEEDFAGSDDDDAGPTAEERAELRQALMSKLMSLESFEQERIDQLREMIRRLDATSIDDLGMFGEIDDLFSSMMEPGAEGRYAA